VTVASNRSGQWPLGRFAWPALLALVALLAALPLLIKGNYALGLVNLGLVSLVVVIGLNFITGYCGQINFAQAAFWGIGAYVTAALTLKGLSFWLALPLSALATAACTLLLGLPTLRLRAYYLAMATIAFGEIVQLVLVHWEPVTGGTSGLRGVPGIQIFGWALKSHAAQYEFLLLCGGLALALSLRVRHSKLGRAMIALRDSEIGAEVMGVDTVRVKMLAFMLSSVYAGVAGSLYVGTINYVSPDLFSNAQAVLFFVMLVIGGTGSAVGAVLGTLTLTVLPEALRFLKEWYLVLYGVGIIAMITFVPGGLVSLGARWRKAGNDAQPDAEPPEAPAMPFTAPGAAATASQEQAALLSARDLTQRFGGLVALDAISVDIAPGTVHAVIGPNGSGKTTFLNVLSGAYVAQSGSVTLAGVELLGRRPSAIARAGLSRTFQNIRLYKSLTVLENVMVGAACHSPLSVLAVMLRTRGQREEEAALRATALSALALVGLAHLAQRPSGSLAYAQQRRLEIARAVAAKPKILLLDEPAAGMNPQEAAELVTTIRTLRETGITVVFVEHNVRMVMSVSDRVTVFDFGRKIAEGTPTEVQADPRVIEAYLGRPRALRGAPPDASGTAEPAHA
jgi:ABC-type branched-subunit amino acid transport system ATPase component/ABC-type branched-subunit amino acid transport system permease subunit